MSKRKVRFRVVIVLALVLVAFSGIAATILNYVISATISLESRALWSAPAPTLGMEISTAVLPKAKAAFSIGGRAHVSGGIIMQGSTRFIYANASTTTSVSVDDTYLVVSDDGVLCVKFERTCYSVPIDEEFAAPMLEWVLNGTETAFSFTERRSEVSSRMRLEGMIEKTKNHFIASELDTERFFELLLAADYKQRSGLVVSLPPVITTAIKHGFNVSESSSGISTGRVHESWTNADYNTTYTTVLRSGVAETFGRPFRYYWTEYRGRQSLEVTDVRIFRDPDNSDDEVLRDIVQLYQTAAVLRTYAKADPDQLRRALTKLRSSQ